MTFTLAHKKMLEAMGRVIPNGESALPPPERVVARCWRRLRPGDVLTTLLFRGEDHDVSKPFLAAYELPKGRDPSPKGRDPSILFARSTLSVATGLRSDLVPDYVPLVARMAFGDEEALTHDGVVHVR